MNKTKRLLGKKGANFVNAFVTTPLCCPSRSSILTGQYVHNHQVYSNQDHCVSSEWKAGPERRSFGAYLQNANYRTGRLGLAITWALCECHMYITWVSCANHMNITCIWNLSLGAQKEDFWHSPSQGWFPETEFLLSSWDCYLYKVYC